MRHLLGGYQLTYGSRGFREGAFNPENSFKGVRVAIEKHGDRMKSVAWDCAHKIVME
ncbi:MAG: hypothetical protein QW780_02400 [Sulfolobales archaeon]